MSFADLKKSRAARQHARVPLQADPQHPKRGDLSADNASENALNAHPAQPPPPPPPPRTSSADDLVPLDATIYGLPDTLYVRTSKKRGRCVYAAKPLKAGTSILCTTPAVSVISTALLRQYCSTCGLSIAELGIIGQDVKALKRCTSCRVTHYCSVKCQKDDWTAHKPECAAHKSLRALFTRSQPNADPDEHSKWIMTESMRALGRLCWARKAGRVNGKDPDWWATVAAMESHVKRLGDKEVMELGGQIQRLRHYLSLGTSALGEEPVPADMVEYGFTSSSDLLNLFSSFAVNSFTLSTPFLSPIGVASSPSASLFNHSCLPNCAVVFPTGATKMDVVALRDIPEGEEVLMSYIDISLPKQDRQADLAKRYGFECDCSLCLRETDQVDPRWCIRHQGCKAGNGKAKMPHLTTFHVAHEAVCDACGKTFSVDLRKVPTLIDGGKRLLVEDEAGALDRDGGLGSLSQILPALLHLTPPCSYPAFALLRLQALLLSPPRSPTELQTAISSLALAYAGAEATYPLNHPTLAIILAEWGKTLSIELEGASKGDTLRRLMEAVVVLRKAFIACEGGFGKGGGVVGKEVEGLIRGCEGEIGLLRRYAV